MAGRPPGNEPTFLYELEREGRELDLIEYLERSEKPIVRYRAAEILGGLATGVGPDSDARIGRALEWAARRDEDETVRAAAVDALYLRDEERLEGLIEELAAEGIDDTPAWADVDRIPDLLGSEHPEFRLLAAAALGETGDPDAVPSLVDAFTDADARVRGRAVRSCGKIGDPRPIDALAVRLNDRHERVRREAAAALASIGTEGALEALAPAARDDAESVTLIAVGELGRFGNATPLPLLFEALRDRSETVVRTATRSLLELLANAPVEARPELRDAVTARLADETAGSGGAPSASALVPNLVAILNAGGPTPIRRTAAWLLGRIVSLAGDDGVRRRRIVGDRDEITSCLLETLEDPDDATATFATETLIDLGGYDLRERLEEFLERDDLPPAAVDRAERALEAIDDEIRTPEADETVVDAVEFTYVERPSDYTAKRRDRDGEGADEGRRDAERTNRRKRGDDEADAEGDWG
ncbi:HEAT repeat domain-containing protein [Natrialbaceae archaeon GCM10025810]|uniref:HEAT repeat domain-containing protein n=1 Tax=Halovalidus salilacus TaxID=3075124 RepID=UPI0036214ADC